MTAKIFSLLIFVGLGFSGVCQSYIPFPDSGAVWVSTTSYYDPNPIPHCEFLSATNWLVHGDDTLINAQNYTKVMQDGSYFGAIRDANGEVYLVKKDSVTEILVYDFTVDVGDTVTVYDGFTAYPEDFVVNWEPDSILIYGNYRKRIQIGDVEWVEGIGNITQGLFGYNINNVSGWCYELECMSVNDSTLFPSEAQGSCYLGVNIENIEDLHFNIYPNPNETGILYVDYKSSDEINYTLMNIGGKIIYEDKLLSNEITLPDSPGIYMLCLQGSFGVRLERVVVR